MSSRTDYYSALERNDTVGARWKAASDNRASLPAADPFKEAVRLSSEHPEPFPIDPNAPKVDKPQPHEIYPADGQRHFRWATGELIDPLVLAPFDRDAINEWNAYLSQGPV